MSILGNLFGNKVDLAGIIRDGAVIIDVRSAGEYRSGHVKGSVNIPLDRIEREMKKIKNYNKPIVTCCASGMRSGSAKNILKRNGIECYNGGSWSRVKQYV